jgi:steroid delta-isomerase-like uncharacterized protein
MDPERNKATMRRWFEEVWNQGRVGAIDEMLPTHGVVHGLGPDVHGPAEFKPFHATFRDAFPDMRIDLDEMIAEGDLVAARWTATGTHRGDSLGFPATGQRAQFSGMVFGRFENGQIVEGWNNFDQLGLFTQLGAVTPPAAP